MEKVVEAAPFEERATFDGSLLVRVMNTRPGAGVPSVTGNATELFPGGAVTLAGKMIPLATDTLTVALETVDTAEFAVIVAEPVPTPVTGTETLAEFAGNITVDGTVAAPVFEELRFTV